MSAAAPAGRGTLLLIALGIWGIVTSVTMVGPLLVDIAREFELPVGRVGLLAAAAAAPQALTGPVAGLLSDRFGRRPVIVLGLAGMGLLGLAASLAPAFGLLVAVRFAGGCLGALPPPSLMAAVGDLFPASRRAGAMGWLNMGFSLAAVAGVPLMGAVAGAFGWRWAFVTIGLILLGLAGAMRLWFPPVPAAPRGEGAAGAYRALWSLPRLPRLLAANVCERSMFGMMTFYLPSFLMVRFDVGALAVAPFLAVVALGAIAGNVLGGWLGDRFGRLGIYVVAEAAAGLLGLALFAPPLGFAPAVALAAALSLANSAGRPPFLALASELAPEHRGALFGVLALTNQTGMVLGSVVGAAVIELAGYGALAWAAAAQGLLAAGLCRPLARRRPWPDYS
jgi:predicted MFS family arabinose efflux permease